MSLKVAPKSVSNTSQSRGRSFFLFLLSFMGLSQMIFFQKARKRKELMEKRREVLINMKMNYACFNGVEYNSKVYFVGLQRAEGLSCCEQ